MSARHLVFGLGAFVVLVSALADVLRIGGEPGFGYEQGVGVLVGIVPEMSGNSSAVDQHVMRFLSDEGSGLVHEIALGLDGPPLCLRGFPRVRPEPVRGR